MDLSRFARRCYTDGATPPIEPAPRVSAALAATCPGGRGPAVWINIPGGGSKAIGGLGYVACAQELQQRCF